MANNLNIPKKTNKFEQVEFVHEMTDYQKNVLIKNMWENIIEMANLFEEQGYTDVAKAFDTMLDGRKWSKKEVTKEIDSNTKLNDEVFVADMKNTDNVLVFDAKEKLFRVKINEELSNFNAIGVQDYKKSKGTGK